MKLSMKIALGYAVIGIFVLLCAGIGLYGLESVSQVLGTPERRVVEAIQQAKWLIIGAAAGGLCLAIGAAIFLPRLATAPLQKMAALAHMLASGQLPSTQDMTGQDAYSAVARAASTMADNFRQSILLTTQHATALETVAKDLATVSQQIVTRAQVARDKATATTATVKAMIANMDIVSAHAQATETEVNVGTTMAEQMTATINALVHNTSTVMQEMSGAVQGVATASEHLIELDATVAELSRFPEAIMDIATQTQCLALNAALAIARTSETTMPGFTTIASDLEELAAHTQDIVEQIRQQVTDLQRRVANAVEDMQQISNVMHETDMGVVDIATAMETQTVTTHTVVRHVTQLATELQETRGIVKQAVAVSQTIATDMATVEALSAELETTGTQMTNRATTLNKVSKALQEMTSHLA